MRRGLCRLGAGEVLLPRLSDQTGEAFDDLDPTSEHEHVLLIYGVGQSRTGARGRLALDGPVLICHPCQPPCRCGTRTQCPNRMEAGIWHGTRRTATALFPHARSRAPRRAASVCRVAGRTVPASTVIWDRPTAEHRGTGSRHRPRGLPHRATKPPPISSFLTPYVSHQLERQLK
jgi:hypothetical protein